jgi:hypothetical protein
MSGVFVFEPNGDMHVFASEDHAAGWLEAIDVENGEYAAAYLHDGTVVDLATANERVILRRTNRHELQGLMIRLRAYRRATGQHEEVGDLVAFANDVLRREWEGRWPRPPRWLKRWFPGRGPMQVEER